MKVNERLIGSVLLKFVKGGSTFMTFDHYSEKHIQNFSGVFLQAESKYVIIK